MARQATIRKINVEKHAKGSWLRDFILGWQDGLVNVLGVILGVATATTSKTIVIVAAMAAAFAESVSMAAVAYTSFKAEHDYYKSEENREKREIEAVPKTETKEVREIYTKLGFKGSLLDRVVKHITSNKQRWLDVMMSQELKLNPPKNNLLVTASVVGISALIGSFIPATPFFFLPIKTAVIVALIVSTIVLFFVGVYKAKTTVGNPLRSGIELAVIGMLAALAGYAIGIVFGILFPGAN
ncbi:MAG: VIT1/CCC1 transporter family protein [Candidatus Nanoarchaeia archaeon]|nr:VIT1/CCC1 transporter family protein [Candidatus Nanoarchaeia archaeon]MDD5238879.1 VIT1/CCC1 transporter family protein [Candidatus Nanoarchaeia archaeon]